VQPWASVHEKLGFHGPHNHPDSTFSAVYYVDVPVGSGDISFADPRVPTASPLGPTLLTMRHVAMQDGIPCKRKRSAACNMHDHHAGMCAQGSGSVPCCRRRQVPVAFFRAFFAFGSQTLGKDETGNIPQMDWRPSVRLKVCSELSPR
jgi:hypothetical protein